MRHQHLDIVAVRTIAAAQGIDTASELARRAGISQPHLSRILNGKATAMPSRVIALAQALGVEPADIVLEEDVPA